MPRYEFRAFLTVEAPNRVAAWQEALRARDACEDNAILLSLDDSEPDRVDDEDEDEDEPPARDDRGAMLYRQDARP